MTPQRLCKTKFGLFSQNIKCTFAPLLKYMTTCDPTMSKQLMRSRSYLHRLNMIIKLILEKKL